MWDSKLLSEAILFAEKKHDGQKMKFPEDVPYSAHVFGVTMIAAKYGLTLKDVDMNLLLCATVLHDTLEDTQTTHKELENLFGKQIADGVFALTKNKDLPKEKQMVDCIEKIKKQPKEIAIAKMADRMFNIRCRVSSWTKEKQEHYKQEAEFICEALGYVDDGMKKDFKNLIENY